MFKIRQNLRLIYIQNIQTACTAQCQQKHMLNGQKISIDISLQRRHRVSEKAYDKMLNITKYQRNANQNYNEVSSQTSQNGRHQTVYKQ